MLRHAVTSAVLCLLFTALAGPASAAPPKEMSVQIRQGILRATPSFLGKNVSNVSYGDRLEVVTQKGNWTQVSKVGSNVKGWIHDSALTTKRIVLKAGADDAALKASSGELALAGKGFNSDVEAQFKSKNKDISFAWVDKMEKIIIPMDVIQSFLKKGEVNPVEGGTP